MEFTTDYLRDLFLNFFKKQHDHTIIASGSLIPANDPSLLFTNAGMVQFKDIFLGKERTSVKRAVTAQKCMRVSGKHNDLENVGYSSRHHTFFEMLGNFSFGDYFKKEAIHFAWEYLTQELKISSNRLWVTVHEKDAEAKKLWEDEFKQSGFHPQGLSLCGDKDNFWAMGETGPCGFCSEIFYDHGNKFHGAPPPGDGDERYVEIWNLVFMQFDRDKNGNLALLPRPSVDTGMGLERIATVMQRVSSNYDIDVFKKIINDACKIWKISQEQAKKNSASLRVIADHIRAIAFLIADGIIPSNEGRGYVVRRIIRRAVRHLRKLESPTKASLVDLVKTLIFIMGKAYPELINAKNEIERILHFEEALFLETLDKGLKHFEDIAEKNVGKVIPGDDIFYLYDTFGFPVELTMDMAKERGFSLDMVGFENAMNTQRQLSRAGSKFVQTELKIDIEKATDFVGYEHNSCQSTVIELLNKDGKRVDSLKYGEEGIVILNKTPFYAESGGQVGDSGELAKDGKGIFIIDDTKKYGSSHLHFGKVIRGNLNKNDNVFAEINVDRRQAIRLNHSSTHLLHKALNLVVGAKAEQRGSFVDDKRLRFDFTHLAPLTAEELKELESLVNAKIRENLEVRTEIKSLNEAKKEGAKALFGEKYGEQVRVVAINNFSRELCGGTHVKNTGEIGVFKIISESGIAAGIRRIEAVTGNNALEQIEKNERYLQEISLLLNVPLEKSMPRLSSLLDENKALIKELEKLKNASALNKIDELVNKVIIIKECKILISRVENIDVKALRQLLDVLKHKLVNYFILLASVHESKISLVAAASSGLTNKISAADLIKEISSQIDGSGGGKPEMAQGGGVNIAKLDKALELGLKLIREKL